MANLTSSRIASLSLPPSSIAHLGIRGNALAGPSVGLLPGRPQGMKRVDSSLEEISDSETGSEGSDSAGEEDVGGIEAKSSGEGDGVNSVADEEEREVDGSFISAEEGLEQADERGNPQLDPDGLKQEALQAALDDDIKTPKDSPAIPTSPPPSYELATSFPLPKRTIPSPSSRQQYSQPSRSPPASTAHDEHPAAGPLTQPTSPHPAISPPTSPPSRLLSPKAEAKQPLPPLHPAEVFAAQVLIDQIAPEVLERIPSSGSETSLYRAFRDAKSPKLTRRTTDLPRGGRDYVDGYGNEDEEAVDEVDPNVFEMDISEPPSPAPGAGGRRRSSVSVLTSGSGGMKKSSSRRSRDKGKSRSSGSSSTLRPLIRIVDRSGGAWNEAEEEYELGDEAERDKEVDADELTRRILGEEAEADAERGAKSVKEVLNEQAAASTTSPVKPETVASRAVKERPNLNRSASTSRSFNNRSPLSRPQSPSASPILSRSDSSLGTSLSPTGGPFARDVRVLGWRIVGGKTKVEQERSKGSGRRDPGEEEKKYVEVERGKIGAYVVYEVEVLLRNGNRITRLRRYNDFDDLRQALKVTFPKLVGGNALPKLPPKTNFSKFEPKFLDDRQSRLQYWLRTVLLHPDLGDCEVCRNWVLTH